MRSRRSVRSTPSSGSNVQARRLMLDTSAYSHLRAGHEGVLAWVGQAEVVYLSAVVLGELEAGFRLGNRFAENCHVLSEFLAEPFVMTLDVTAAVARRYGQVFAELRRSGTPIPVNDIWIAAHSLEIGAHLLTFDGDFEHVQGLEHVRLSLAPRP